MDNYSQQALVSILVYCPCARIPHHDSLVWNEKLKKLLGISRIPQHSRKGYVIELVRRLESECEQNKQKIGFHPLLTFLKVLCSLKGHSRYLLWVAKELDKEGLLVCDPPASGSSLGKALTKAIEQADLKVFKELLNLAPESYTKIDPDELHENLQTHTLVISTMLASAQVRGSQIYFPPKSERELQKLEERREVYRAMKESFQRKPKEGCVVC